MLKMKMKMMRAVMMVFGSQLVAASLLLLSNATARAQNLPPQPQAAPAYSYGPPQYESGAASQQSSCLVMLHRLASEPSAPAAICIGQQDVEMALEEARTNLGAQAQPTSGQPSTCEHPKPIEIIAKANVVREATRILAHKFQLSETEILFELAAIDASKSAGLAQLCPSFLRDRHQSPGTNGGECFADDQPEGRFRSLSGFCNNPHEAAWGSARSAMVRFLAPDYQDSVWRPRVSVDGSPLPSARVVSFIVHQDPPEFDHQHSMLGVVWGQLMNHDVNQGARITEEDERLKMLDCCASADQPEAQRQASGGKRLQAQASGPAPPAHPDCFPIEIPRGDPFFGYFNQKCMNFVRLAAALQPGCSLGPVQAMNKQSSYLDGSAIYGTSSRTLQRLRAFRGGLLKSQPVSMGSLDYPAAPTPVGESDPAQAREGGHQPPDLQRLNSEPMGALLKELLPPNVHAPDVGCERRGRPQDLFCFDAGDLRANEQIQLASLHTIFMREHNRLAREFSALNPHWQDERLFQEARKVVVAQLQHISYAEFLPIVVGSERVREFGLEPQQAGQFYYHYDPKINAGVRVEFQSAAFRYGHSLVPGHIERFNRFHRKIESIRLSKLLKQPFDLYFPGMLDTYIMGLVDQRSGRMDPTLTTEVANHLFERPGNFFGLDLAAINIQRAREMGVPGYNSYREFCGLPKAVHFADLAGSMSNKTLLRLAQLYRHVDDIDLFTGGVSEFPQAPDALIGPTFSCLIARQAAALRDGDRFWHENPGQFTIEQLDEIRKQTAARLLCDNADELDDIQPAAMLMPGASNPRVPCASLPSIDLSRWRERAQAGPPAYDAPPAPVALVYDTSAGPPMESLVSQLQGDMQARSQQYLKLAAMPPLAPHQNHMALLVDAVQRQQKQQEQATHSSHFHVNHVVQVGGGPGSATG